MNKGFLLDFLNLQNQAAPVLLVAMFSATETTL